MPSREWRFLASLLIGLSPACGSGSGSPGGGPADAGIAVDAGNGAGSDGAADAADEASVGEGCHVDATWTFERVAAGGLHALAAGRDGKLHALVQTPTGLDYYVRSAAGVWGAAERTTKTPSWSDTIRMAVDSTGRVAAIGRASTTYLQRAATGEWSTEEISEIGANFVPGLFIDDQDVVHVVNGRGATRPPAYARRAGTGPWTSLVLPATMKGAETSDVAVVEGAVTVCSVVYPFVMCAAGDGTTPFGASSSVEGARGGARLHMFPTHLVSIADGPSTVGARALRRATGTWSALSVDDARGVWGASDGAVDKTGVVHLVQALQFRIAGGGSEGGLRYTRFGVDGSVKGHTIACGTTRPPNVEVLDDGRVFVSYVPQATGGVFVGSPE